MAKASKKKAQQVKEERQKQVAIQSDPTRAALDRLQGEYQSLHTDVHAELERIKTKVGDVDIKPEVDAIGDALDSMWNKVGELVDNGDTLWLERDEKAQELEEKTEEYDELERNTRMIEYVDTMTSHIKYEVGNLLDGHNMEIEAELMKKVPPAKLYNLLKYLNEKV